MKRALKCEDLLERFALLANKSALHPRDWKTFYEFVAVAHSSRLGWDAAEIRHKLILLGFDERHADDLANAYWHGRCVLHMSKPRPVSCSHHDWLRRGGIPWT